MATNSFREKLKEYYYRNGFRIGKNMLVSTIIVAVGVLLLIVLAKFGFTDSFAMILAIPMLSICVSLTKIATTWFFSIFNFRSVIVRTIITLFAFIFISLVVSSVFTLLETLPEILTIIFLILFDAIYVGIVVWLLSANRLQASENNDVNKV